MTRARTLADLGSASLATDAEATASAEAAAAAVPTGRKNLLYNGAMQVAQRGTSKTGIGSGDSNYHTSDRWYTTVVGSPTFEFTQSVENDAPTGSGFRKCLKMLCTTAQNSLVTSDSLRIEQRLEGQDIQRVAKGTASAQQVTLSFWVKSNVTGNYVAGLLDNDNTRYVAFTYNVSASATWEKKTIAFPADTTGAFDNDSGYSLSLQFWLAAGPDRATGTLPNAWESYAVAESAVGQTNLAAATNNYWQITGVQLEVGDTATDFEHKPFGVELAECQRYYWRQNAKSPYSNFGIVRAESSTSANALIIRPMSMRTHSQTVEFSGLGVHDPGDAIRAISAMSVADSTESFSYVSVTAASGMTAGTMYWLSANNNISAYLGLSAEL